MRKVFFISTLASILCFIVYSAIWIISSISISKYITKSIENITDNTSISISYDGISTYGFPNKVAFKLAKPTIKIREDDDDFLEINPDYINIAFNIMATEAKLELGTNLSYAIDKDKSECSFHAQPVMSIKFVKSALLNLLSGANIAQDFGSISYLDSGIECSQNDRVFYKTSSYKFNIVKLGQDKDISKIESSANIDGIFYYVQDEDNKLVGPFYLGVNFDSEIQSLFSESFKVINLTLKEFLSGTDDIVIKGLGRFVYDSKQGLFTEDKYKISIDNYSDLLNKITTSDNRSDLEKVKKLIGAVSSFSDDKKNITFDIEVNKDGKFYLGGLNYMDIMKIIY